MTSTDRAAIEDAIGTIRQECNSIQMFDGSRTCRDLAAHVSTLATICSALLAEQDAAPAWVDEEAAARGKEAVRTMMGG